MVKYKCNRCLKIFTKKSNYISHNNRKFKCEYSDEKLYTCNGCKKVFYNKTQYTMHLQKKKCV